MAWGSLIIKERYGCSDEDIVGEIRMYSYRQFFLGMHTFTYHASLDASMLPRFRKYFSPALILFGRVKASSQIRGTPPMK